MSSLWLSDMRWTWTVPINTSTSASSQNGSFSYKCQGHYSVILIYKTLKSIILKSCGFHLLEDTFLFLWGGILGNIPVIWFGIVFLEKRLCLQDRLWAHRRSVLSLGITLIKLTLGTFNSPAHFGMGFIIFSHIPWSGNHVPRRGFFSLRVSEWLIRFTLFGSILVIYSFRKGIFSLKKEFVHKE